MDFIADNQALVIGVIIWLVAFGFFWWGRSNLKKASRF